MAVIVLNNGEMTVAATLATLRQGVNREVGIANQKAGKQDPITTELVGLYAELAFSRWANVAADLSTHLRRGSYDATYLGYTVDVKGTRSKTSPLYLDTRPDKRPDIYVLVQVEYATCTFVGWIFREQVCEVTGELEPKVVERADLYAMEALINL